MKLTLLALAAKYRVQVLQYTPGHLIIQIHQWHLLEQKLPVIQQLIDHDPHILAYSIDGKTLEIMFDEDAIFKEEIVQKWFSYIRTLDL
ncbi:MAG TPA: hypothetical protein H9895_11470 [Candidatus Pseudogracilibacillus intestinigallinarum]|uniref:Uncharacterized protein n=1 Tax=Candidatus Pseudogracilibacillus intestinigallinarum TaxID=2838742 RepID=A0A9D1PQG9_9BACI|nr:hypothetical protein [Candidatus Pseudogracilibacillus intestinigallinarum]